MESEHHSSLVVKSNALVNAMFDLTLQGNRFLAFAISLLDRSLEPTGQPVELEIPVLEFAKTFEVDSKNAYREIEALADQFQRKIITLEPDQTLDGSRVKVGLISKQKYLDKEGRVWLKFDEDLVPHLLGLREQFTKYRIKDVYQFSRASTWRVYELLKQYKPIGKREFEIEELKRKVGVPGLYKRIEDLKRRVIDPAVDEINNTSDILVDYSQRKRGRRIVAITFHILDNPNTKTPREKIRINLEKATAGNSPCLSPDLARQLREDYGVAPKQAKQIADLACGVEDQVQELLPKLRERWNALEDQRTSLGGYVFKALRSELIDRGRSKLFE